ncbi:MAG: hypothetical protein JW841_15010 [Deltaproteobacteria bacterium]|nr:hypothetical protein [Deltaproteobacteria bacterium]
MRAATLHVKIDKQFAQNLKDLADKRGQSVGELVRQALGATYQLDLLEITNRQRQGLEAYRGGFISLSKLAEIMGMHILELRTWLNEHAISQNNCFEEKDPHYA